MASLAGSAPSHASQCGRILAVLSDGEFHEMTAIHRQVGFCRLNSRISELRARYGKRIDCDKTGGVYRYRLLDEGADARQPAAPSSSERRPEFGDGTGATPGGGSRASSAGSVRSTSREGDGTEAIGVRASSPSEHVQLTLEAVA